MRKKARFKQKMLKSKNRNKELLYENKDDNFLKAKFTVGQTNINK